MTEHKKILRRMWRHRWTAFLLVAMAYILSFFHRVAPSTIAGDLQQAFHTSGAQLGVLAATYFYVYTVMQIPTGILVDTLGPRRIVAMGGLIGGWLAVELVKSRTGIRVPTGDGFAAPLAVALACGRLGCWWAGCCAGVPSAAWCAVPDAHGVVRIPVPLIEAGFHAAAGGTLLLAARRSWQPGRRLSWYLLAYAGLRLVLEPWREHPPLALGLSWYQFLALGLAGLCLGRLRAR